MNWIGTLGVLLILTGCASSGGSSQSGEGGTARAEAIAKVHTELAGAYYERQQYSISLQELDVALRADSDYAPAYGVRGLVRMALREDSQADSDFRRALRLDKQNSDIHNNYGWFLCQRGRIKESFEHFREALSNPLYTTPEIAHVNMGVCQQKLGLLQEAGLSLHRALLLRPDMPSALYALAMLEYAQGDFARAKADFLKFSRQQEELTAEQLLLAVRIERRMRDRNSEASYALQLRKRFPTSKEAQLLMQGGQ